LGIIFSSARFSVGQVLVRQQSLAPRPSLSRSRTSNSLAPAPSRRGVATEIVIASRQLSDVRRGLRAAEEAQNRRIDPPTGWIPSRCAQLAS